VHIGQGALQGKVMTSRKGRRIHAFQGIPYAEPPVGDLRFQVRMHFFTLPKKYICVCLGPKRCARVEWRAHGPERGQLLCPEAFFHGKICWLGRLSLSQCLCAISEKIILYLLCL
jgi:Carboxylesterase family